MRPSSRRSDQDQSSDAIRRLQDAKDSLPPDGSDWKEFAVAARNIQTALLSYEKSPLFLNRVVTRQRIELLRLALRALVVGNQVGTDSIDGLVEAKKTNQALLEQIAQIEQTRAETVSDSGATEFAFLDRDTARKLAGIVRRRLAIADEVVSLRPLESFPNTAAPGSACSGSVFQRRSTWLAAGFAVGCGAVLGVPVLVATAGVSRVPTHAPRKAATAPEPPTRASIRRKSRRATTGCVVSAMPDRR